MAAHMTKCQHSQLLRFRRARSAWSWSGEANCPQQIGQERRWFSSSRDR